VWVDGRLGGRYAGAAITEDAGKNYPLAIL
jgi:hypothetical protein